MIKPVELETTRNGMMQMIKANRETIGLVVEVGTYKGHFAEVMYNALEPDYLYAVDPFKVMEEYTDNPSIGKIDFSDQDVLDELAVSVENRIASVGKCKMLRTTSVEASKRFINESLDVVYIDGCHKYESVKKDISVWYPKVKTGGILCGHDYVSGVMQPGKGVEKFGVIQAVQEFVQKYDLKLAITNKDKFRSWVVCKDNKDLFF